MKRLLFATFIVLFSYVSIWGQMREDSFYSDKSKEGKLLRNAITNGRQPGSFYIFRNEKNKNVTSDELLAFARGHRCLTGKISSKEVKRFGDFSGVVNEFEFLPLEEFPQYVFECMYPQGDFSSMSKNGSVYLGEPNNTNSLIFKKYSDVMWSGDVGANGMINGQGYGFLTTNSDAYYQFRGTFHNGLPEGDCFIHMYQGQLDNKVKNNYKRWQTETGTIGNGMIWFKGSNDLYGFIDKDGNLIHDAIFKKISDLDEKGVVTVEKDGYKFWMDKKGALLYLKPEGNLYLVDLMEFCNNNPDFREAVENTLIANAEKMSLDLLIDTEKSFPELSDRLLPFKMKIYEPKAEALLAAYDKAVKASQGDVKYADVKEYQSIANDFIDEMSKFDPKSLLSKAKDLYSFCTIVKSLEIDYMKAIKSASNEIVYIFEHDLWEYGEGNVMSYAIDNCKVLKDETNDFQAYASRIYAVLKRRESQCRDAWYDKKLKNEEIRLEGLKHVKVGSHLWLRQLGGDVICTARVLEILKGGFMLVKLLTITVDSYKDKWKVGDVLKINPYKDSSWFYLRTES